MLTRAGDPAEGRAGLTRSCFVSKSHADDVPDSSTHLVDLGRAYMRACLLGLLCFAALLSTPVVAQNDDDFILGGVRLQLGTPEAVVRRQLEENHTITAGGFVTTKNG